MSRKGTPGWLDGDARPTKVSRRVSGRIKALRLDRNWTMNELSLELYRRGFKLSPQVINTIENGVYPQKGYAERIRPISVDELVAFAEVFGLDPVQLLGE